MHEIEVGRGIDIALDAIQPPGIRGRRTAEGLGNDCLDDIAGGNVFLDPGNLSAEGVRSHPRGQLEGPLREDGRLAQRVCQQRAHLGDGVERLVVSVLRVSAVEEGIGH